MAGRGEASAPPPAVRGTLAGYWRLARLLLADSQQAQDLLILHIPRQQVAALKQAAAGKRGWELDVGWKGGLGAGDSHPALASRRLQ